MRPKKVHEQITQALRGKLPNFFIYAKQKEKHQVEEINKSPVNRLRDIIYNKRMGFKKLGLNPVDWTLFLDKGIEDINLDSEESIRVIETYINDTSLKSLRSSSENVSYILEKLKMELMNISKDCKDILVKYLYINSPKSAKGYMWEMFKDEIAESLTSKKLIQNSRVCNKCFQRIENAQYTQHVKKCKKNEQIKPKIKK